MLLLRGILDRIAAWRWRILVDRANIDVGLNASGGVVTQALEGEYY